MKQIMKSDRIDSLDEHFYPSPKLENVWYPGATHIIDSIYAKGKQFETWLMQAGLQARIIGREAMESGSKVHNAIDSYLRGEELTMEGNYTMEQWELILKFTGSKEFDLNGFWGSFKPELITTEISLANDELKYGGTIDLICKIHGQTWLIDHKTSIAIYDNYNLQLMAYKRLFEAVNPEYKIDRLGILWLKAGTRGEDKKGQSIQGRGWKLVEVQDNQEEFDFYMSLVNKWHRLNPDYRPHNFSMPLKLKMFGK